MNEVCCQCGIKINGLCPNMEMITGDIRVWFCDSPCVNQWLSDHGIILEAIGELPRPRLKGVNLELTLERKDDQ